MQILPLLLYWLVVGTRVGRRMSAASLQSGGRGSVDIAAVVAESGIDGVIVSNTTLARPGSLRAAPELAAQAGGLSGAPLFEPSTRVLARMHVLTGGKVPLIGVGGVASAEQAYDKIKAGASLVQVYTALAYSSACAELCAQRTRPCSRGLLCRRSWE